MAFVNLPTAEIGKIIEFCPIHDGRPDYNNARYEVVVAITPDMRNKTRRQFWGGTRVVLTADVIKINNGVIVDIPPDIHKRPAINNSTSTLLLASITDEIARNLPDFEIAPFLSTRAACLTAQNNI